MPFAAIATPERAALIPSPRPVKICLITPSDCLNAFSTPFDSVVALAPNPLNGLSLESNPIDCWPFWANAANGFFFRTINSPPIARPAPLIAPRRPPALGTPLNIFLMPSTTGFSLLARAEKPDCTDLTTALTLFLNDSLFLYRSMKYFATSAIPIAINPHPEVIAVFAKLNAEPKPLTIERVCVIVVPIAVIAGPTTGDIPTKPRITLATALSLSVAHSMVLEVPDNKPVSIPLLDAITLFRKDSHDPPTCSSLEPTLFCMSSACLASQAAASPCDRDTSSSDPLAASHDLVASLVLFEILSSNGLIACIPEVSNKVFNVAAFSACGISLIASFTSVKICLNGFMLPAASV